MQVLMGQLESVLLTFHCMEVIDHGGEGRIELVNVTFELSDLNSLMSAPVPVTSRNL